LQKPRFTLGRDPHADISIADPSVSRIHAELSLGESDVLFITDCNSSNGTFLLRGGKETRIHQSQIELSDKVKLGSVVISAADLATALRRKAPPQSPEPVKQKRVDLSASVKLIRCECGAVKRAGGSCPSCSH
jgi:pSer/pThr/pTyr-binding forkhead associated (FHA) protein